MHNLSSTTVLTPDHLEQVVEHFAAAPAWAFDVETTGDDRGVPTRNVISWIGMATDGMTVSIPMGHPNGVHLVSKATRRKNKETGKFDPIPAKYNAPPAQLRPSQVWPVLAPLFESPAVKVAHNATFDLISVTKYLGFIPKPAYSDTIVLQWLLNENTLQKGLKDLVKRYYGVDYDQEQVGRCVEAHPFHKVAHYQYMDAKYTWFLYKRLQARIEEQGLQDIRDLEMDVLGTLLNMGTHGAKIDHAMLTDLEADLSARLVDVEAGIYKAAGQMFNLNAPAQKAKVIYGPSEEGGQGLKTSFLTDGGKKKRDAGQKIGYAEMSTSSEALEELPANPVVQGILQYQELSKLLGTYVQGYLGDPTDPKKPCRIYDGQIHADFVQYGTVTGRFSCRAPNLQNIPRPDTELGKKIRGMFIAPPGHKLIVADYGQIELVVLAHYIHKGRLFDGFHAGVDPHSATAAALVNQDAAEFMKRVKAEDPEAKKLRQAAKGINFAVVYGAGPDKVAAMADTSLAQAKKFLKIHEEQFPEIYKFKTKVVATCKDRKPPHIKTLLGRKRRLPEIHSQNFGIRGKAERQAVNSLIQGSAADLIKYAMVRLDSALEEGMHLSLTVHDELVVVARDDVAERCADIVRDAMLGPGIQHLVSVPLSSDVKTVERWSDAK